MREFLSIAWPGLVVLGGLLVCVACASVSFRRTHRPGFYRSTRDDLDL